MKSLSTILACLVLVAGVSQAVIDEGECPVWTTVDEFDLSQYTGRWYEHRRFEESGEDDLGCVTADYVLTSETTIDIFDTGMLLNGDLVATTGSASTTSNPGELATGAPEGDLSMLYILGTDYQTYSCVYSCLQTGELREQWAWVISKDIEMDGTVLEAALGIFEASNVDVSFFQKTTQLGNCTYVAEP